MATHLTRNSDNPSRLNGITYNGGNHLLIVKHTGTYNNVEMIATPIEEKFIAAAAWGDATSYNTINSNQMASDANVIIGDLNGKINAMTTSSWTNGHKNIFAYYARSGCPGRCKWQPSSVTIPIQQKYLEFAATRHMLKFDLKYLPFGNFSSVNVYLRFRNPSFVQQVQATRAFGYNYAHNDTSDMLYSFKGSLVAPNKLEDGNCAYCRFTSGSFANQGNMSSSGTSCDFCHYDCWNLRDVTSLPSGTYERAMTPIYYNLHEWDNDHQITDANVLTDLKSLASANRYVYLMIGPRIANGISSIQYTYGAAIGSTICVYSTRVELVFRLTGSAFNN